MDVTEALRRRRMVRSFTPEPLDPALVDRLLEDSLRAPTAGHTRGVAWLALCGTDETAVYWEHATTAAWRDLSSRWPGLARAPLVALSLASPDAYVARYAEADKASSGLGAGVGAWPVPYWFADAAGASVSLLLLAVEAGLGACLLGAFRGEAALLGALGVPAGWRLFGAVLVGHPDGADHRSPSLDRPGPSRAARVHRGRW